MELLHISLALALRICQPVLVLKQFCGDFITFVIALGRDYLAVISDAVIDQVAVRIVCVMMPYQDELSVFYSHQFHIFPGYFSHKFICQQCLVFRLETQCDVSDRLFDLRIKLPLVVETIRYFPDISQQYTVGVDDFRVVLAHYVTDTAAEGFPFLDLANHDGLPSPCLYRTIISLSFCRSSVTVFWVRWNPA